MSTSSNTAACKSASVSGNTPFEPHRPLSNGEQDKLRWNMSHWTPPPPQPTPLTSFWKRLKPLSSVKLQPPSFFKNSLRKREQLCHIFKISPFYPFCFKYTIPWAVLKSASCFFSFNPGFFASGGLCCKTFYWLNFIDSNFAQQPLLPIKSSFGNNTQKLV